MTVAVDAKGLYYRPLNQEIRKHIDAGEKHLEIKNVNGQRYIGAATKGKLQIDIYGVPGNDTAAYMDGTEMVIYGNAQDALANTMNDGKIVVHGHAGDTVGYGMRGGEIYIRDYVGYRIGIHMKSYLEKQPVIVIGGKAGDFFGEYMAGGLMILLGLDQEGEIVGDYLASGMHGGKIFIRGQVPAYKVGPEIDILPLEQEDRNVLAKYLTEYEQCFGIKLDHIRNEVFSKILPKGDSPYKKIYTHL